MYCKLHIICCCVVDNSRSRIPVYVGLAMLDSTATVSSSSSSGYCSMSVLCGMLSINSIVVLSVLCICNHSCKINLVRCKVYIRNCLFSVSIYYHCHFKKHFMPFDCHLKLFATHKSLENIPIEKAHYIGKTSSTR